MRRSRAIDSRDACDKRRITPLQPPKPCTEVGNKKTSARQNWHAVLPAGPLRIAGQGQSLPGLEPIDRQYGLFALLPLTPGQTERLRVEHGVYVAGPGRINLAGLTAATIPVFIRACQAIRHADLQSVHPTHTSNRAEFPPAISDTR